MNPQKEQRQVPFYQIPGLQDQLSKIFEGYQPYRYDLFENQQQTEQTYKLDEDDEYEAYENYEQAPQQNNTPNQQDQDFGLVLLSQQQFQGTVPQIQPTMPVQNQPSFIQHQDNNIQQLSRNPSQQQYDQMLKIGTTKVTLKRTSKIDLKLFVGQIPKNWVESDVTTFFSESGEILESQIIRDTKNGYHKGCAFVKFASMTEAEAVIESLQGKLLDGMTAALQIKWADGESDRLGVIPGKIPKLFVGSLPKECTEDNLKDIFEPFGPIDELHLNRDPDGRSKGTAIIRYDRTESALLAIRNLNAQAYLQNSDRPLEVKFAERKQAMEQANAQSTTQPSKVTNPLSTWVVYYTSDNVPYYYNCLTQNSQYEKPPPGSVVYSQDFQNSYVEPTPQTSLNDMAENGLKRPGPTGANLFIFHLPSDFKDSDLFNLFKPHGNVISARVITQDGKSKGYGFVSYDSADEAKEAISKMNGFQVTNGKRLLVKVKDGEETSQKYQTPNLNQSKFNPY